MRRRFNPFKKTYGLDEMEMLSFLGELILFSDLTTDERALFLPHLHTRTYEKDEVVFLRNDPAHALYIVAKGEVVLTLDQEDDVEEIMRVDKGSIIGETSILKDKRRFVNAIVVSERATLFVLPQVSIYDIFSSNIKIKVKMLEAVSNLYHDLNQDILRTYQNSRGFFYMSNVYNRK